jgi:predicted O-linked N-acetylglucosamine transferase (SPINDLY family)
MQRAIASFHQGDWATAERLCRAVLNAKADYFDALQLLGVIATQTRRTQEAALLLSKAVSVDPENANAHYARGNALRDLGQSDDAIASYRRALEIRPDFAEAHTNLGYVLQNLGQLDDAVASHRRALKISPDFAFAYNNLGGVLQKLGRLDEAVASYRRALEIKPNFAEAHTNLGNALQDLGQLDDAVASHRRAIEINPTFALAYNNLGNALYGLAQLEDSAASYRGAIEIEPDFAAAHNNLGNALRGLRQLDDAVASCRRALEIKPDYAVAHHNLGNALHDLGRLDDAVVSYRRALEIKPDFAEAYDNLGNALSHALGDFGQLDEAAASYRRALESKPSYAEAHSNLLLCLSHNRAIDSQTLFAEHCRFGEQFEAGLRAGWPVHRNPRDPTRPLQIGLVSADLRDHAVAYFLEPLLAHLTSSPELSLHAYHNHAVDDSVTARLRGNVGHWHPIAGLSDAALAQRIGDDGIDILIDLSGHTAGNRLLTFARKPAPVQASWMGYPGTTGLRAMDYYLADRCFLPPRQFEGQFTEKLVYLPASVPFLADDRAPPVNTLPALSKGYVTFGSFNRPIKLRPSVIALWSKLLHALPDARMVLGGMPRDSQYDLLIGWFAGEGIVRERLSFYPCCDIAAYLSLHHQVDMCLDTFPYTGGTTTNHALWMGVPTLTLAGPTPPGRQGAAIMGRLGLEAFVAESPADFQQKGLAWAGNLGGLAEVRAGLRECYERSPMRHPEVIAAALERAFRTMWQRWCAGLPPESIDLTNGPS